MWEFAERMGLFYMSALSGVAAWVTAGLPLALFGVPFAFIFAGFAGAVLALGLMPPMPRWKMFFAVAVGTLSAAWLVLPATELLSLKKAYPGVAFVIGLTAYLVITWCVKKAPDLLERKFLGENK